MPVGADALSQSLQTLAENEDDIRSRTAYLGGTINDQDMPRYKRLKMGMLQFRQKDAQVFAQQKVQPLVEKSEYAARLKVEFSGILNHIQMLDDLLAAGNLSQATAGLQGDVIESSRDLTQLLARQNACTIWRRNMLPKGAWMISTAHTFLRGMISKMRLSFMRIWILGASHRPACFATANG